MTMQSKATNGLMKLGKFHDTFFMGMNAEGKKEISVVKVIGWVVLLELLTHVFPVLFVFVLAMLVVVGIGGGPRLWNDDNVIDGTATVVPEPKVA